MVELGRLSPRVSTPKEAQGRAASPSNRVPRKPSVLQATGQTRAWGLLLGRETGMMSGVCALGNEHLPKVGDLFGIAVEPV